MNYKQINYVIIQSNIQLSSFQNNLVESIRNESANVITIGDSNDVQYINDNGQISLRNGQIIVLSNICAKIRALMLIWQF